MEIQFTMSNIEGIYYISTRFYNWSKSAIKSVIAPKTDIISFNNKIFIIPAINFIRFKLLNILWFNNLTFGTTLV